jgi:hypothetical protein
VKYKEIFKSWKVEDIDRKKIELKYRTEKKNENKDLKNRTKR